MESQWAPIFFIQIWSEPLEPLLPVLDSGLDLAWVKARAKARFLAQDSMTRHDLARSSARLGSRSSPARDTAYCSSGLRSPRLGLARLCLGRLDSAWIGWLTRGSVYLGSRFRLDFGLWIWARESARYSARLNSELGSCSARVLTQDSRLGIRLSLTRGSAWLIWFGCLLGWPLLSLSRLAIFYIKETIHRRTKCATKTTRRANARRRKTSDKKKCQNKIRLKKTYPGTTGGCILLMITTAKKTNWTKSSAVSAGWPSLSPGTQPGKAESSPRWAELSLETSRDELIELSFKPSNGPRANSEPRAILESNQVNQRAEQRFEPSWDSIRCTCPPAWARPKAHSVLRSRLSEDEPIPKPTPSLVLKVSIYLWWFAVKSLKINPYKTELVLLSTRQRRVSTDIHVQFGDVVIRPTSKAKILGFILDSNLTFENHISAIVQRCYATLSGLAKFARRLPQVKKLIIEALVFPHIHHFAMRIGISSIEFDIKPLI